jgi:hypothetical protein
VGQVNKETQASALNEDVLKYTFVEWKEIEEGKDGREALRKSAK